MNACNELLVRATNEGELLQGMCKVAVDVGGYQMAWIGFAENDAGKTVRAVAAAGAGSGYSEKIEISWADCEKGLGPTGTAIRTGQPQVSNNLATDPNMAPWRERALAHGFGSTASFPLRDRSGVLGSFTIYSDTTDTFGDNDVRLLSELASDLAYGIMALRDRAARLENERRLKWAMESTVQALAHTVEQRDPYTAGHQHRVAELAAAIAREEGLSDDEITGIYMAGMIHDIGKIQVPIELLTKPGRLSQLEFQLIQEHAQAGYEIIKSVDFPWPLAPMVLQHHERLDGSGYPNGLKGDAILPGARILAVADVVEAMNAHRPYRPALGIQAALQEIELGKGQLYDERAVDICVRLIRSKQFSFD